MPSALSNKIRKAMVSASAEFHMIDDGDRIMVAVSGGKDSTILLLQLEEIRLRSKISFSVHPVLLDQKQPGFAVEAYKQFLKKNGFELTVLEKDTYSIVVEKTKPGKSLCSLCSRMRRGILYQHAEEMGYTKIALGHHRDDLNETLMMNLFFNGQLASMPPKLRSDCGKHTVIRPLAFVPERHLTAYAKNLAVPTIPCNLCGNQLNLQRQKTKQLLAKLESEHPGLPSSIATAQKNVQASQLLDTNIWDFLHFERIGKAEVNSS